ncbi:MAG TPA: hypothetical protein DCX45_03465 [Acinetobacter junii]|nr:hypothetical protein [Acinetobacter junii]
MELTKMEAQAKSVKEKKLVAYLTKRIIDLEKENKELMKRISQLNPKVIVLRNHQQRSII